MRSSERTTGEAFIEACERRWQKEVEEKYSTKKDDQKKTNISQNNGDLDFSDIKTKEDFRRMSESLISSGVAVEKKSG